MKVVLDLSKLLNEGKISSSEYERLSQFASSETSSLAFNILLAFGVVAVSCASIALVPSAITAIVMGVVVSMLALSPLRFSKKWGLLSQISVLIGALMLSGGILWFDSGSLLSWVVVTLLLAIGGIIIRHGLLIVLSVLALSAAVGTATAYEHAMYELAIQRPTITILLFSALAYASYKLSFILDATYQHLAILASRTSIFLVNLGFWIGSLWGDRLPYSHTLYPIQFTVIWAILLVTVGAWAAKKNRRWVVNICAIFGGIHFYTQWFEYLGAQPLSVLIAGLLALVFAIGLKQLNTGLEQKSKIPR